MKEEEKASSSNPLFDIRNVKRENNDTATYIGSIQLPNDNSRHFFSSSIFGKRYFKENLIFFFFAGYMNSNLVFSNSSILSGSCQ